MLRIDRTTFTGGIDKPFRVKFFDAVVDQAIYERLLATFPTEESMQPLDAVGRKYSLNDRNDSFAGFIAHRPEWQNLHRWFRAEFARLCNEVLGVTTEGRARVRFEFSSLPGDDGGLYPHPDTEKKVATAVLYCEPDWQAEWGGGFEALRHLTDPDADFTNRRPSWEEVETILTVPVTPRRILFMQRTNNSLHGVRPLHAGRARHSVTVNLIG